MSPTGLWAEEPILLDWLLLDVPLKNLRSQGSDWRLRVSVNDDSFLVDRQTPLWLKGWPEGRSGILLELVDDRGEPLNPPFNSLVTEVDRNGAIPPPVWLRGRLGQEQIDRLLGRRTSQVEDDAEPEVSSVLSQEASSVRPLQPEEQQPAGGDGGDGTGSISEPSTDMSSSGGSPPASGRPGSETGQAAQERARDRLTAATTDQEAVDEGREGIDIDEAPDLQNEPPSSIPDERATEESGQEWSEESDHGSPDGVPTSDVPAGMDTPSELLPEEGASGGASPIPLLPNGPQDLTQDS